MDSASRPPRSNTTRTHGKQPPEPSDMTEALPLTSQIAADWLPLWKAAGFFFATFILEDVAAIGAGLLLASGQIPWSAAFLSCFLGIWLGDVGLYAIARTG